MQNILYVQVLRISYLRVSFENWILNLLTILTFQKFFDLILNMVYFLLEIHVLHRHYIWILIILCGIWAQIAHTVEEFPYFLHLSYLGRFFVVDII